jgi:hypothetical protein
MAEFLESVALNGFDANEAPRWQMVPLSDSRYVILSQSNNCDLTSLNTRMCEVVANPPNRPGRGRVVDPQRLVELRGRSVGDTFIEARVRGTGELYVRLAIAVREPRRVRTTFHLVSDPRHDCGVSDDYLAGIVAACNLILQPQANVQVEIGRINRFAAGRDLGDTIRYGPMGSGVTAEEAESVALIRAQSDDRASWNYFFVWDWDFLDADDADEAAVTNQITQRTYAKSKFEGRLLEAGYLGQVMAHELCHTRGIVAHSNDSSCVMFNSASASRRRLRRMDIEHLNRLRVAT